MNSINDPQNQYNLALAYFNDKHVEGNLDKAVKLAGLSAKSGYGPAHDILAKISLLERSPHYRPQNSFQIWHDQHQVFKVGVCYHLGLGVTMNRDLALRCIQRANEEQNLQARFYLGKCYLLGDLVPKNASLAVEYLTDAANNGLLEAKWQLALIWLKGIEELDANVFKGLQLLYELINANNRSLTPLAHDQLGIFYLTQGNQIAAKNSFSKGAYDYDLPKSYLHLGVMHLLDGENEMAIDCFEDAENRGVAEAGFFLAKSYLEGNRLNEAETGFRIAAARGVSGAYFELGKLLFRQKKENAVDYLIKALKRGYSPFYYKLGEAYLRFSLDDNEIKENIEACNLAAKRQTKEAFLELGGFYFRQNQLSLAQGYYEKAVALGSAAALERLGSFNADESLFKKAAALGDRMAYEALGDLYAKKGDIPTSISWFQQAQTDYALLRTSELNNETEPAEKAANRGYVPAMMFLGTRLLKNGEAMLAKIWFERVAEVGRAESSKELAKGYYNRAFGEPDLDKVLYHFEIAKNNKLMDAELQNIGASAAKMSEKQVNQLTADIRHLSGRLVRILNEKTANCQDHLSQLMQKEFARHQKNVSVALSTQSGIKQLEALLKSTKDNIAAFTTFCDQLLEEATLLAKQRYTEETKVKLTEAVRKALTTVDESEKPFENARKKISALKQETDHQLTQAPTIALIDKIMQNFEKDLDSVILNLNTTDEKIKRAEKEFLKKIHDLENKIEKERRRHQAELEELQSKLSKVTKKTPQQKEIDYERTGYLVDAQKCLDLLATRTSLKPLEENLKASKWNTYDQLGALLEQAGFSRTQNGTRHCVFRFPEHEELMISLSIQKGEDAPKTYRNQVLSLLVKTLENQQ